ncbi:MAG TPA: hypothetical protein VI197_00940 [Polyangiaceae bacterium]
MRFHGCVLFGVLLAACGGEDVLVFDAVPGAGGSAGDLTSSVGGSTASVTMTATATASASATASSSETSTTGMTTEPCSDVYDCGNYFFCQKDSCSAAMGACEPRPVLGDPDPDPVCGCDGVTYWNDSLRRQFGVASATPGECSGYARRCNSGEDCGVFPGYCARILPPGASCDPEPYPRPEGTCWVIPPRPEMVTDSTLFLLCPTPSMPAPEYCADTHLAIASQLPHIRISELAECPNGESVQDQ